MSLLLFNPTLKHGLLYTANLYNQYSRANNLNSCWGFNPLNEFRGFPNKRLISRKVNFEKGSLFKISSGISFIKVGSMQLRFF